MIVLIFVDFIRRRRMDTSVSLVRLARRDLGASVSAEAGAPALARNVNVHGPAARSLTTAATGGALKERKSGY